MPYGTSRFRVLGCRVFGPLIYGADMYCPLEVEPSTFRVKGEQSVFYDNHTVDPVYSN